MFSTQKFPYKVRIYIKSGDTYRIKTDMARKKELKSGPVMLHLKKLKKDIEFPEFKYFYMNSDDGSLLIDFECEAEGEFRPVQIKRNADSSMQKEPIEKDTLMFFFNNYARIQKKYELEKSKWEKLIPLIMFFGSIAMLAFVALFVTQSLVSIAQYAAAIANQITEAKNLNVQQIAQKAPDVPAEPSHLISDVVGIGYG